MAGMRIRGAKAGQKQPRKPNISKDTAASISTAKLLYGLGEGEIYGLADGAKSIRLDGTPLVDDAGNPNFEGVTWDFRNGSNDQEYIKGFPDVSNETPINVELRSSQPWIKAFNDTQISAVRVRFKWNRLSETNGENGDVKGYKIDYAIDLQTDGGAYQTVLTTKIQDKTSAGYERTHRIDLPQAKTGWQLRVRRITPNSTSDLIQDTMMIDAVAEVIDVKLSYPNTALLGVQYNAELFSNIAKMSVRVKGKIIRVPDNYDPVARTYTGIWTGSFKDAYSNNPAWVFYDLCTQWRGGLGERLDATMIDRWSLYALGQYCDQPVSDGQGGLEPRFTCNVYLQKQEEAYTVLQNIAGIFRAMSFWTGERIMLDADVPQDPIYTYSSANIVGGVAGIQYSGTRNRDRHTLAKVAWDNPNNDYQTEYEYVRDEKAMSKFGVKVLDLSAFGCTSQAQAQRAGLWALKTEQLETRQVTFSVGLDGAIPTVGNIISLSDEAFAGRANGGRVSTVNSTQRIIELDREVVASVGDVLIINGGSGKSERRNISNVVGNRITVTAGFTGAETEHIWAIETADLKLMRFRVMSITENDDATYAITAIQHEPQKYDAIDFGTDVKPTEITIINPDTVDAPASVTITSRHREVQGQTVTTLIISWSQVKGAVAYDVEWRKDDGSWIKLPRTGNVSAEIDGVYSGNYLARVRAISAFDVQSQATTSTLTAIEGKVGLPPTVVGLTATGVLFGMDLKWGFQAGSGDAAFTEIQVGSAPNVNIATLGQYSYPTNTHTINGLQGNLKQSYRARLVDKLGFKSPWSAWVTGTTDANADKIMDLIEGQITESHLYQELTDKIDKVDKIEPLELLVGDETKGLVKAIADERDARIDAIGTSALEGSKSLHERADALAGTVNGITEWQDVVDTDIEKGFAKMTYLASELDFGYADKTQHASTARGTAWTFAKTVARADYVNSELARGLTADLAGAKASFTEQITATAAKNFAATQKIENLSAQVVGGYEGNDLGALSSGLLYQESTARASDYSALAEQISLLSAGVGEQFDPYQIWHFDKDSEGWTGGTYNGGYINARTDKLQSPSISREFDDGTVETLNTNAYHYIKMRLEVVGTPTWSGLVEWSGGSATITEPVIDEGVANISFDLKWSGSIDSFTIKIAETADNLNYYKVDWIAVGRPSPGASSAAVLDIRRAFSDYKVSSSERLTDLTSTIYGNDLTPLTASIREQLNTLATDSSTYAGTLSVLDTWYKGEDASMAAITKQQYEALTSADSANARKVDELFAEMDFGYADRTKFANINRSMQRTLATTIAVADWTQNQRIDTLQSEFQGNTAQIQNELLTLASKDLAIASEQTRLSTAIGENSADILNLSLAVTSPESGLAAQVTQLQATAEAAERLAGTKGEIIYSVAEPPTKDQLPQNLWFKKEGENTTPHVWDVAQSKWVALTDKAAADAQAEANAAKQAAGLAQDAADDKGEVIFSSTAPAETKQLAQNLWIDTGLVDGKPANTPKRWDGSAWVEVTDKATKDAASAASAAQGAAEAAQDAADDAADAAALAQGELDDISDDDKLTPSEKKQLRIIVDDIKQVDTDIKARAAKYEVSTTEYDKAYKELVTDYINDLLADHDKTSNIVRTEFNRKFNEFFAKRAQLDTSIAIAAKSVADGLKSDLSLGYASRNKYASKRIIPNNVATVIARAQLQANEANMAAIEAQGSAQNAKNAADDAKLKADVAQGQVNDIASDSKLTPVEKKQVKLIIDDIKQVDADIKSRAAKYEVSTTEYGNAYTALVTNYINALLVNPNATDNIDRNVFNERFNTFFTKRAQLDTAITVAAKEVADDAQQAANAAQGAAEAAQGAADAAQGAAEAAQGAADAAEGKAQKAKEDLSDIYADGKVTPSEKQQIKTIWTEIVETDVEVRANADKYGVPLGTYPTAYTNLESLVNTLLLDMNKTVNVNRTTLDDRFEIYYRRRAVVNRNIIAAAEQATKDAASAADAAAGAASAAAGAASAAQGAADVAQGQVNDISADGKLTPVEKKQASLIWSEIAKTDTEVRANAAKYKVSITTYSSAYTALNTYLNGLITGAEANTTSIIDRAAFDKAFADVYAARAEVNKLIVVAAEKQAADAASAADAAQGTANGALGAAQAAQVAADAAEGKAQKAKEDLSDIYADGKVTPSEKHQIKTIWTEIVETDAVVRGNAAKYDVNLGTYPNAYTNLESLVDALLLDMNATTNVNRTTLDGRFEIYYRRRAAVNRDIVTAAEKQAADAKTAADNKGEVVYSNTAPAADKRKTQNLWVDTTDGKNVFKRWNGNAWIAVTDQTAVDIANSKGEVITSDKIPATTKRLPQNLWIDTRQGKNTPRRWNGLAWEAVTDQAAIDAVDDVKLNLATYVKESGAYSTEFGNIAGEITTIQSTVEGVTDSIEVVAAIGDAERLKYEISKERLNKNKAALQGKVADLDSLIVKYKAQRTDAQAKKAQATDASVIAAYDAQIALLNTSITDTQIQRSEVAGQVAQMEQEITELASLKLTESEVKKQYFVKFDSGNRAAGFGIMENADATIDFAVLADKFYIAAPSDKPNDVNGTSPFMVLTNPQNINGVQVDAGTYMRNFYAPKGSIDTLQVAEGAIKSAQIDDLAVTTGKIDNLAVDTLQINNRAVTVAMTASSYTLEDSGEDIDGMSNSQYNATWYTVPYSNNEVYGYPLSLSFSPEFMSSVRVDVSGVLYANTTEQQLWFSVVLQLERLVGGSWVLEKYIWTLGHKNTRRGMSVNQQGQEGFSAIAEATGLIVGETYRIRLGVLQMRTYLAARKALGKNFMMTLQEFKK